eukprot:5898609-Pleurochrysis_carterae.AAC.6
MVVGNEEGEWEDDPGGEVLVTIYRDSAARPELVAASALLRGSVGIALGVMGRGKKLGATAPAHSACGFAGELSSHSTSPVVEALELRLAGGFPELLPRGGAFRALRL